MSWSRSSGSFARTGRAFTLLELVVASTLLLLLLGLAFSFLVPALRYSRTGMVESEIQQAATLSMRRIVGDLEDANAAGISWQSEPTVLSVHRVVDANDKGRKVYAGELVVYLWDKDRKLLLRRTWPPEPPSLPAAPTTDAPFRVDSVGLGLLAAERDGKERILARYVEEFSLQHAGVDDHIGQPLTVRLLLENQTEVFELEREVSLRSTL